MNTTSAVLSEHRDKFLKYRSGPVTEPERFRRSVRPFHIFRLEDVAGFVGDILPPRGPSQHYFELIRGGSGYKTVGSNRFPVLEDRLFIVPEHVGHARSYAPDIAGYFMAFDRECFPDWAFSRYHRENYSQLCHTTCFLPLAAAQADQLSMVLETLLDEVSNGEVDIAMNEIIPVKILEFLILIHRFSDAGEGLGAGAGHSRFVRAFTSLIDKHWVEHRSVTFYASALHMHPNSLNTLVRAQFGQSTKAIINKRVTEESKSLLASSDLAVHEIAFRLGFDDPNYFSYFFKRQTGISPQQYKHAGFKEKQQ